MGIPGEFEVFLGWHKIRRRVTGIAKPTENGTIWPMSQDKLIKLVHKATGEIYRTRKNKKKVEKKIELNKYSAKLRKRVKFKESK